MATLQDEVIINGMRLRNRIALPPITTNYGSPEGIVTDDIIQFYTDRSNDVGLVIVEACAVRDDGRILRGSLGLWDDGQVPGMARLAAAIKKLGAAAVAQISHAGARCFPAGGSCRGLHLRVLRSGPMWHRSPWTLPRSIKWSPILQRPRVVRLRPDLTGWRYTALIFMLSASSFRH